jgi:hypothetical protein
MVIKSFGLLSLAIALFLLLGAALVWFVIHLLRGNQNSLLAAMALTPEQEVRVEAPGEVVLLIEVPRLATDFRNFQIEVIDQQSGQGATMKYQYLTAQQAVYGLTTMKVPVGRMTVTQPGAYFVRVSGLQVGKNYSNYHLLLSRPYLGRMAFQIVGIVVSGVGMLLSVLWACWLLGLMRPAASPTPQPLAPATNVPGHTIDLETWKRQQQSPK